MVAAVKTAPGAAVKVENNRKAAPRVSRRRRRMRGVAFTRAVACALGVLFLLGYVGLYAQVTMYGYRRAELSRQIRQAEMENQALRAEIQTLSSPDRLAEAALATGLEPSAKCVYISTPRSMKFAKAEGEQGNR
ncbi:MAG: hypothetical protein HYX78_05335 [Armatimonadetes bacterium]|nr:hypothetical protein [Armatimonadota bacterium]